jgi:hypothetical protein
VSRVLNNQRVSDDDATTEDEQDDGRSSGYEDDDEGEALRSLIRIHIFYKRREDL